MSSTPQNTQQATTQTRNQRANTVSTQQHTLSNTGDVARLMGLVKWFNNKPGFGFITVISPGEFNGNDIFVHYNNILTLNKNVYKTLTKGEYVEFTLQELNDENKTYTHQAVDVTGPYLYRLMCENNPSKPPSRRRPNAYFQYNNPNYNGHYNQRNNNGHNSTNNRHMGTNNQQFVYPNGQYTNNYQQ
jgi:CspA family cold shock protein